jgi:glycosyltransferase involved in cell wall biosynthesis
MSEPTLTVVIPNYNHASHLPACLEAILERERPPDELILIDDCSTDNSWPVIQQFAQRYRCIRAYRNEHNLGVLATVNRGLELARGDYFFGAAADDFVLPGFIEKSMALLSKHPQAGLCCTIGDWQEVETGLRWHMGVGMTEHPTYLSPQRMVELERAGKLFIAGHTCIVKRSALLATGSFPGEVKYAGDWFTYYLIGFRDGICVVPEPLAVCQIHAKSYYQRGRRDKTGDLQVMTAIVRLLNEPQFSEPAARMRESGALYIWGFPMLQTILTHRQYRHWANPTYLRKALWHSAKLFAKPLIPMPLGNLYLRLSGYRART